MDRVHSLHRRVALLLLPLGAGLAGLALWTSWSQGAIKPVDRLLLPVIMALCLGSWVTLGLTSRVTRILPLVHGAAGLYLLASLGHQLGEPHPEGLPSLAFGTPLVCFFGFLYLRSHLALGWGLGYVSLIALLLLVGWLRGSYPPTSLNALSQFLGSNLAYLALVYLAVRLREEYLEVFRKAHVDFLTGLPNRRYLDQVLARELERAQRYRRPLSLALLDLDNFKRVNDTFGHEVGDRVLRALAQAFTETLRPSDRAVRLGGEEFVLLFPETPGDQAFLLAERTRERVASLCVPPVERLTASLGVAEAQPEDSPLSLLKRADEALYKAKGRGKNRVERA